MVWAAWTEATAGVGAVGAEPAVSRTAAMNRVKAARAEAVTT